MNEEELVAALYKRAMGFNTEDLTEEYTVDNDGRMELVKKKASIKYVPPDISAVKILIEYLKDGNEIDITQLSDEELEQKLRELKEEINKETANENKKRDCFKKMSKRGM